MYINQANYQRIIKEVEAAHAVLVAVSKTKPVAAIRELYDLGHRDFGENYVQELVDKQAQLPSDIRWHFIGHLQSNKVKYIAPFVHLIHGIDSSRLLLEVNRQAQKNNRILPVLLQVHIAEEETKYGLDAQELQQWMSGEEKQIIARCSHVSLKGLMGMASFSEDETQVRNEFKQLKRLFDEYKNQPPPNSAIDILSMGMSGDYRIALQEGSSLVRIGSLLFGSR